jgi:catechol 2,3-dioxygenase-like lactoylglutathione lyase family enzyme
MTAANGPPPRIDQFLTFLPVEDLERSHAFYADDLGLPLVLDQGSCRIYRVSADGFLGICRRPGRAAPDGTIVTIVSDDVDGWHRRLAGREVTVEREPRENPEYRVYHAFYRDPDGHLIEIQRFLDPRWPTP